MTTTEEPTEQAPQQARQGESVKHLPERLSRRYRNRVLKLSSSYRNPMVKHEPELHTARFFAGCVRNVSNRYGDRTAEAGEIVDD